MTVVPPSLCSPTQYSLAKKSLSVGAHQTEAPQKNHIITNHNKALSTVFLPEAQLHPTLLQLEAFAHSYMPPFFWHFLSICLAVPPHTPSPLPPFHLSSFSCPCSKSYCGFGQTDTNEVAVWCLHVSVVLEFFCKRHNIQSTLAGHWFDVPRVHNYMYNYT